MYGRDHDTEEEAARAFDRAAINKAGRGAQINFDISDYEARSPHQNAYHIQPHPPRVASARPQTRFGSLNTAPSATVRRAFPRRNPRLRHATSLLAAAAVAFFSTLVAPSSPPRPIPSRPPQPEIDALQKMSQQDLVSTLRSKARRHSSQTSRFRGVSLLKQTGKWHAQINFGGKQLHLGFFAVEEAAARAYDRAAIYKAAAEKGPITTNFDLSEYTEEMERLQSMTQQARATGGAAGACAGGPARGGGGPSRSRAAGGRPVTAGRLA